MIRRYIFCLALIAVAGLILEFGGSRPPVEAAERLVEQARR